jgi:hypothetical protein
MKNGPRFWRLGPIAGLLVVAGCIPAGPNTPVVPRGQPGTVFPRITGLNRESLEVPIPDQFEGLLSVNT